MVYCRHKELRMRPASWLRLAIFGSLLATAAFLAARPVAAADPDFVGVLSILDDQKVVRDLGLSEEVLAKLETIISQREDAAGDLVLSLKELDPPEKTARMAKFVEESEKQGLALLTPDQRTKLNQLRIARDGLISLAQANVAKQVGLSAQQKKDIAKLADDLKATLAKGNERDRQTAKATIERKLAAVLSKEQQGKWNALAGKGPAPETTANAEANEKEPSQPDTKSDETKSAKSAPKPAVGKKTNRQEERQADVPVPLRSLEGSAGLARG